MAPSWVSPGLYSQRSERPGLSAPESALTPAFRRLPRRASRRPPGVLQRAYQPGSSPLVVCSYVCASRIRTSLPSSRAAGRNRRALRRSESLRCASVDAPLCAEHAASLDPEAGVLRMAARLAAPGLTVTHRPTGLTKRVTRTRWTSQPVGCLVRSGFAGEETRGSSRPAELMLCRPAPPCSFRPRKVLSKRAPVRQTLQCCSAAPRRVALVAPHAQRPHHAKRGSNQMAVAPAHRAPPQPRRRHQPRCGPRAGTCCNMFS